MYKPQSIFAGLRCWPWPSFAFREGCFLTFYDNTASFARRSFPGHSVKRSCYAAAGVVSRVSVSR